MLEYVYRLNLPSWDLVKLDSINLERQLNKKDSGHIVDITDLRRYIKTPFLNINGVKFRTGIIFKKTTNVRGQPHIDNPSWDDPQLQWGINWISGADGGMEYWPRSSVERVETIKAENGYSRPGLTITTAPEKTYHTANNGVYLVNASIPHNAFNYDSGVRFAVTARPNYSDYPNNWDDIVQLFSNLIIDQ